MSAPCTPPRSLFSIRVAAPIAALALTACAASREPTPDYAAKNRPLHERCFRVQREASQSTAKPGATSAEVRAEAQAAARRGELDKACEWL